MILRNLHTLAVGAIVALPIFFTGEISFAKRAAEGDAQQIEQEKNRVTSSSSSSASSDSKSGKSSSSSSDRKSSGSLLDPSSLLNPSQTLKRSSSKSSSSSGVADDSKKLTDPSSLLQQKRSASSSSSADSSSSPSSTQDPRSDVEQASQPSQSKSASRSTRSSEVLLQAKYNLDEVNGDESMEVENARELRVRYLSRGDRFRLEAKAENFEVGTKFEVLVGDVSLGILTVEQDVIGTEGKIKISERNKPADMVLNITEGTIVKFVDEAGVVIAEGPMVSRK